MQHECKRREVRGGLSQTFNPGAISLPSKLRGVVIRWALNADNLLEDANTQR